MLLNGRYESANFRVFFIGLHNTLRISSQCLKHAIVSMICELSFLAAVLAIFTCFFLCIAWRIVLTNKISLFFYQLQRFGVSSVIFNKALVYQKPKTNLKFLKCNSIDILNFSWLNHFINNQNLVKYQLAKQ